MKKENESLEEILTEKRDFTEEEMKERTARTMKLFRALLIGVGAVILLLLALGIFFGG